MYLLILFLPILSSRAGPEILEALCENRIIEIWPSIYRLNTIFIYQNHIYAKFMTKIRHQPFTATIK